MNHFLFANYALKVAKFVELLGVQNIRDAVTCATGLGIHETETNRSEGDLEWTGDAVPRLEEEVEEVKEKEIPAREQSPAAKETDEEINEMIVPQMEADKEPPVQSKSQREDARMNGGGTFH